MIVLGGGLLYFSTFVNTWQGTVQTSAPLFELFYSPGSGADLWLTALIMIGGGLTFNAIDLAVTYKTLRADGMSAERTPVFAYSVVVSTPTESLPPPRCWSPPASWRCSSASGTLFGIFNPVDGGSPLLWKTLFQWWSHSAPYLITVVAIGAVSEILAAASGRSISNASAAQEGHPCLRDPRNPQLRRRLLRRPCQALPELHLHGHRPRAGHPGDRDPAQLALHGPRRRLPLDRAVGVRNRLRSLLHARDRLPRRDVAPGALAVDLRQPGRLRRLAQPGLGQRRHSAVSPRCCTGSRR